MSAITLHRTNAARNMHRYYRLDVQPDLFGEWCFVREWGRIGRPRRCAASPTPPSRKHTPRSRVSAGSRSGGDTFDRSAAHVISGSVHETEFR